MNQPIQNLEQTLIETINYIQSEWKVFPSKHQSFGYDVFRLSEEVTYHVTLSTLDEVVKYIQLPEHYS